MQKSNNGLIASIIFAAVVIAGALVFFGFQIKSDKNLDSAIEKGIENFIEKQQKNSENAVLEQQKIASENLKLPNDADHIRGNPDAEITIVEYSDFECPYCKRFHGTMNEVLEKFDGKVNWIYRHFPLGFHDPIATKQAEASECVADLVGTEKYWEFVDLIFETTNSNKGMKISQLPGLAEQVGVNRADFDSCFESEKFASRVQTDIAEGARAGVRGTPGSFIVSNRTGEIVPVPGALPFARMEAMIKTALEK